MSKIKMGLPDGEDIICLCAPVLSSTMCGMNTDDCGYEWADENETVGSDEISQWIILSTSPREKIDCPSCLQIIRYCKNVRL